MLITSNTNLWSLKNVLISCSHLTNSLKSALISLPIAPYLVVRSTLKRRISLSLITLSRELQKITAKFSFQLNTMSFSNWFLNLPLLILVKRFQETISKALQSRCQRSWSKPKLTGLNTAFIVLVTKSDIFAIKLISINFKIIFIHIIKRLRNMFNLS